MKVVGFSGPSGLPEPNRRPLLARADAPTLAQFFLEHSARHDHRSDSAP